MTHHYCVYFDHNYLPRALVMIQSLRAVDARFHLHIVSLSDLCTRMLAELALPEVSVTPIHALERRYPELLRVKPERKPIEYIFTMTPFLPAYFLDTVPGLEAITYLDADLSFYADPQAIFDRMGACSIGLAPNRYSADHAGYVCYGLYNVGWITFRATSEGLRCLGDYQRDCVAWCYDRVEDGRFADQAYLDRWPQTYAGVHVIDMKGVNAATFNVDSYTVTERAGGFWCDDDPLIFYHFHGVFLQEDGSYWILYPKRHGAAEAVVVRRLYRPYLARLLEATHAMRQRFPAFRDARQVLRPVIGKTIIMAAGGGWQDDMLSRRRLVHALELRDRLEADPQLDGSAGHFLKFGGAIHLLTKGRGAISVLDWGGGFGEHGRWMRKLWPDLALDYHVVEVNAVCDYGGPVFSDVTFHDGARAFERRYDIVVVSAALQYMPEWRTTLDRLAGAARCVLIVVDVPTANGAEGYLVPEHPLAALPEVEMVGAVLDEADIRGTVEAAGLVLSGYLPATEVVPVPVGQATLAYRSFLFARPGTGVATPPGAAPT